jgi:hypothetical protein
LQIDNEGQFRRWNEPARFGLGRVDKSAYDPIMKARQLQSEYLQTAKAGLRAWAEENAIPLANVAEITGADSGNGQFGAKIWLFFETDVQVTQFRFDGTKTRVQDAFLKILQDDGYPAQWLEAVTFDTESRERIDREFEGSTYNFFR